jgi:transposase
MPVMRLPAPLRVPAEDVLVLRRRVDVDAAKGTAVRRARIVLLSGEGLGPTAIAEELRCSKQTVITWRERYREAGVAGLIDAPRPGRPATVCFATLVRRTLDAPPDGTRRWTTRTLGADLGVSNASVGQAWRRWGVTPAGPGRVELATDPGFDGRVAAVTGVHLGPAVRALALRGGEPTPPAARSAPTSDIGPMLEGPRTPTGDDIAGFLQRVGGGATTVLLADGPVPDAPPRVAVHIAPPGRYWARIAQVGCWIAEGACAEGAESVAALTAVLEDHVPGTGLSWTRS